LNFKLTPVGRHAVVGIFLSAFGAVTVDVPIYLIFCGLVGLFGCVEFTGMLFRPKLEVTGLMPAKVTAGGVAQGQVRIVNNGKWPAYDIMCSVGKLPTELRHTDGTTVIPEILPGEEANLPVSISASRRGEYVVPELRIHSTFPFNLMRFGTAAVPANKLIVLPRFEQMEQFELPFSVRFQAGGILSEKHTGDSPEYVGNREYVPGEPIHRLDFKAWARVGKPVVREYQNEYSSRVAIVLDTFQPRQFPRWNNDPALEAAVSLTASIADCLNQTETVMDVFAAGPDLFLFQAVAGTTHFDSVLEILAAVDSTRQNPFERLTPVIAESLESISTVVCVFLDWDEARETLTRQILESGCSLRVFVIRNGETTAPFHSDLNQCTLLSPQSVLDGGLRAL